MSNLRTVGREQEDRAAQYLRQLGYTLVTRQYRTRHGEIDLIALDGDLLVFVEVKARWAAGYSPEAAVGDRKRRSMVATALQYLGEIEETEREIRFDLIAIDRDGLRHHRDIFGE